MGPHKTKNFLSGQGLSGNWPIFFIFFPGIVSACSTRAYMFHVPRTVHVARAASYGGRRRDSDIQSGSSGRSLPPAVARLP